MKLYAFPSTIVGSAGPQPLPCEHVPFVDFLPRLTS